MPHPLIHVPHPLIHVPHPQSYSCMSSLPLPSSPPHSYLPEALDEFTPDMIVYNAGTDILVGDALGRLNVTPEVQ